MHSDRRDIHLLRSRPARRCGRAKAAVPFDVPQRRSGAAEEAPTPVGGRRVVQIGPVTTPGAAFAAIRRERWSLYSHSKSARTQVFAHKRRQAPELSTYKGPPSPELPQLASSPVIGQFTHTLQPQAVFEWSCDRSVWLE